MDIENHVAVVTGGASGLGAACVALLRQRGARVMVWDRRVDEHDKDALMCDVRSEVAVKQALDETIARLGVPRININCAGIAPSGRLVGKEGPLSLGAFQDVIDINLVGTFNVMRFVTDAMIKAALLPESDERGVIINTASIAAYDGQIGQVAYSASKGAIVSMTLPLARELAQHSIRVNAIAPGLMATPLLLNMPSNVQENLAASVPFPKRFGRPDEFASLVLHVIENSMLNGEVIRLDGALRMPPR